MADPGPHSFTKLEQEFEPRSPFLALDTVGEKDVFVPGRESGPWDSL